MTDESRSRYIPKETVKLLEESRSMCCLCRVLIDPEQDDPETLFDTLEEKIATLQDRKRGLSDDIMGAAAQQQLHWTREELLELLKPLD